MPVHIRSRTIGNGQRRHDVQYRRGGRGYQIEHAGTFKTLREATIRQRLVGDWLAAGKDPRHELAVLSRPTRDSNETVGVLAVAWLATRVDLDDSTIVNYRSHQRQIDKAFGTTVAASIVPADVSEWIATMIAAGLKPGTVKGYVGQLRMILDGLDVNPARHRSVRLPKQLRTIKEPPDADEFVAMLAALSRRYVSAAVLMEQTGMRIGEALAMEKRDIDRGGLRVRVRAEVSKRDRPRWIPVQSWYMEVVEPVGSMLSTSCAEAMHTVSRINPHLLRHRRATLWHQSGLPAVELASRLGHANVSESLNTYSHVRPISEAHSSRILEVLGE